MTTTYPALRGKFGSTQYYVITIKISELVGRLQFPVDVPNWAEMTMNEKFQRRLDKSRIRRHIAPYFAEDERRFSGSLVMAVSDEDIQFESIQSVAGKGKLPLAYGSTTDDLGFISLNGQKLIPLDGQHRAKAFKDVIEWRDHQEKRPQNVTSVANLGDDQVTLILVKFERDQSRYIFNKINKYARPTSKADKLVTDDDNAMAVITRNIIENGTIPKQMVNVQSNSLGKNASEFTLLSTVYDCTMALNSCLPVRSIGRPENMEDEERNKRQGEIVKEWKRLITGIDEWSNVLKNPKSRAEDIMELRKKSLLGRPIGQLALVKGYAYACHDVRLESERDVLVEKLCSINWDIGEEMWRGVLVKPNGRVMYGSRVANLASKLIAYLVGVELKEVDVDRILTFIHGNRRSNKRLPPRITLRKNSKRIRRRR